MSGEEVYLGNGLYIEFDGFHVFLRRRIMGVLGTTSIVLNPDTLAEFRRFVEHVEHINRVRELERKRMEQPE